MNPMNIIEFAESLRAKMKQELDNLNTDQDEIIKIGKVLTFIRGLITELKAFTRNYEFQNQAEEIQFFKEVKPVFLSQYFYYKKVFNIRLFDSFKDVKSRQANYYQMLQRLEAYMKKNLEFYEYCMSGETFLDAHYFTRSSQNHKSPDKDESFSTGYDTKLAKTLANEILKRYILDLLSKREIGDSTEYQFTLTWTAPKTSLVELMYALHASEVFNNGTASIKVIASMLEKLFNISLKDYYRAYLDITGRKKNQTVFLDAMKEKFIRRSANSD
jgi:hypothetical protein